MTTFIGFNTQNQFKKFTLLDNALIKRDLLNALNIRHGQLVGRPAYGTSLWDNLFENQSADIQRNITQELQRVVGGDPRVQISELQLFPEENGMLIQMELIFVPGTNAESLAIFFDQSSRRASYV
ncbi:GpW/Gp25/anti-adapter protein IraD [uncultured Caudovirales phage]|jgi:phage baseplate assembly protein W|uniref:GpW/Gp25/anti-adapter protein IraD n=1 Tax=uncultured Caudovirales phage TaxID=2100421 RepID=A0A6J5P1Q1_9CAUD|nr:GpW/Gp25/anti-adapter protein IraD [uncultured Caudovirales phage]CAB4165719.1 GpW/Gp25/anti-adapter protein IraD [uncultured Caudovirales phage]CAB4187051.1 GpW/Gp25/anti-adapter protein IraD [uncultured Caudovirales phage]CAB4221132.1 GpW/Gp25/anti-adapter protein IraD [uncultured Caudovirales phage]